MTSARDEEPLLPDRPADETDVGWGESGDDDGDEDRDEEGRGANGRGADERRLRDEVPPHHGA